MVVGCGGYGGIARSSRGPFVVNPSITNSPPSEPPPTLYVPCLIGDATFIFFVILQLGIGFFIYRRRSSTREKVTLDFIGPNSKGLFVLSFSEIKSLTRDFKNQIRPKMFKGMLPNNHAIVVKDLHASIEERKFWSAIMKIVPEMKLVALFFPFSSWRLVYKVERGFRFGVGGM
ncbi:hypothetical protein RJT34_12830 [Clitoria ternatea]|uniref:Uncharacterized protein n=1 Tax=Clitoria ternatea TaxID=43366 RepID=A0AAN9PL58_CLITE